MYKLYVLILAVNWCLLLLISTVKGTCDTAKVPWVDLTSGCVEGLKHMSARGQSYYSFQGIPYATLPVAGPRYKAPEPVSNWPGLLQAVEEPPVCLQPRRNTPYPITYSEDCLYLSVFTPYLQHPSGKLMPVIVWMDEGNDHHRSNSSYKYGPDFHLTTDNVVVNVNFRLGIFGHLNTHTTEGQDNAGMMDKIAALNWVQKEIVKFGGDSNSVTITGGNARVRVDNNRYISPIAQDKNICKTRQCNVTASRMLSLVDMSRDPCEDFYSYACGGLFNNPTLLEDDPSVDVWNRIERAVNNISDESSDADKKLKNYYEGCVEYGKVDDLKGRKKRGRKVLDDISTFFKPNETVSQLLEDLLLKLWQHGSSPLFNFKLDVDSINSSKFQMVLTPPDWPHSSHFHTSEEQTQRCRFKADEKLSTELEEAHEIYTHCLGNITEYLNTTQEALIFFGVFDCLPTNEAMDLMQGTLISMEHLLKILQEFSLSSTLVKDIEEKTYYPTPLYQLQSIIPQVSWSYLLSSLLEQEVEDTSVQFYHHSHLIDIFGKLQDLNDTQIHNALLAMFAHDLYTDIVKVHHTCDRERYCLRVASNLMPDVVSKLYMSTFHNHKELNSEVLNIQEKLVKTMDAKLENVSMDNNTSWLDPNSLKGVREKLLTMSVRLPPVLDDSYVTAGVEKCLLNKKNFIEDSICLLKQLQVQMITRYTQDPHAPDVMWPHFLTSFSTHTAFIYGLNTLMVPYSLLSPLYDQEMPLHVVMAKLGNLLARGIGHNFDSTGVKFAASGKLGQMLSEASNPSYHDVQQISGSQFGMKRSLTENGHVYEYILNAELTLNERLSDIIAVNLSLSVVDDMTNAYNNDTKLPWLPFSPKQVYFLAVAQTFCTKKTIAEEVPSLYKGTSLPAFVRVLNIVLNSECGEAFRCHVGSNSNLAPKAKVMPFPMIEKIEPTYYPEIGME